MLNARRTGLARRVAEEIAVECRQFAECHRLRLGVFESPAQRVVPVRLELALNPGAHLGSGWISGREVVKHRYRSTVQVLGREVGSQVGAVAEDGAELHESVFLEQVLTGHDVRAGEDRGPAGQPYLGRNRRVIPLDSVGQIPQDREADNEGQQRGLGPQGGDRHALTHIAPYPGLL